MKTATHPMQAKKDLARRIVTDFHSTEAAMKAAEDWAKQFQKDEVPEDVEMVDILPAARGALAVQDVSDFAEDSFPIRLDKLVRHVGLAASNTDAAGKIKSGAVTIDGQVVQSVVVNIPLNQHVTVRVGRRVKKVRIMSDGGRWQ